MARLLQLEEFESAGAGQGAAPLAAENEELRLAAYEQGYSAGWEDALAAQNADMARLRSDLGHNLSEMAFSFADARSHVLASLEPLLRDMVNKVLPVTAHKALGHMILQELLPVAEGLTNAPILVRTAPENRDIVADLLARETRLPLQVVAEPTLGEGQAYLKLGATEMNVDLDGVIDAIATAVAAFFHIERDSHAGGAQS